MTKKYLLMVFVIILSKVSCAQCEYENQTETLGIGLVEYDNYKQPVIKLFNDSLLQNTFYSWTLYSDFSPPFCTKYFKPDYGIASIVVLDSTLVSFKVLVNETDIKYLPNSLDYVFWTWEEYLLESHGVRRKIQNSDLKNQAIRNEPNSTSSIIVLPNDRLELLCVLEVKGDWIKIKYDCFYNQSKNPNEGVPCSTYINDCEDSSSGWLLWRNNSKILVDIFTMA